MSLTKRETKKALQRERKAKMAHEIAERERLRKKAEGIVALAKKAIKTDPDYTRHALAFEILSEMVDTAATEVNNAVNRYGISNTSIGVFAQKLKRLTGEQISVQDGYFIDKSDRNLDAFAERQAFLYDMLLLLTDVKPEDRIKAESSIKLLIK